MRTIFLDRDGVINENRDDHVKAWSEFCFLPGSLKAIRKLHEAGFQIFIITNQAIIERGIANVETLEDIHRRMRSQIAQAGGYITDIRYCPHDTYTNCQCRKPKAGMLLDLAHHWNIDLAHSYLIGDAWTDIAAGRAVNSTSILVQTGRGAEQLNLPQLRQYPPTFVARDLLSAVYFVIEREQPVLAHEWSVLYDRHRNEVVSTHIANGG